MTCRHSERPAGRRRAGLVATLLVAAVLAAHAAPAANDAVRRAAFLEREDIRAGLRMLQVLGMQRFGDVDEERRAAGCWDGVRQLLAKKPDAADDAQMDACMSAAAATFEGRDVTYVRHAPQRQGVGPAGVGIILKASADGQFVADDVIPGSPADRAGIEPGARLLAVDDESVVGQTLDVVVRRLRGAPGTPVTLALLPASADPATARPRPLPLVRAVNPVPGMFATPLRHAWYLDLRDLGGTLDNHERQDEFERVVAAARPALQPGTRIVLDLRGNGGGLAQVAADIGAAFVGDNESYRLLNFSDRGVDSVPHRELGGSRMLMGHPLVVLIDGDTGGGAAWLAESLHRHAGALLAGRPTATGHHARLGLFLDRTPGARFEVPDSDLFVADGLLIEGQPLAPDVVLDDTRMAPRRMARAPAWLQAWLDDDLPAAMAQRSALRRAAPHAGSQAHTPSGQPLCAGGASMTLPAGFPRAVLERGDTFVRTKSWQLAIESVADITAFTHAETRANIAVRTTAERENIARLAGKPPTADTRMTIAVQKRDLRDSVQELAALKEWDTGTPGARVFDDGHATWLRWERDGFAHQVVAANLPAGMALPARVALLSRLAQRLAPAEAAGGVCLPGAVLALEEPILEMGGQGRWSLGEEGRAGAVELHAVRGGSLTGEGGRDVDSRAMEPDTQWLLDQPILSKLTWPRLAEAKLGGLEAVTRRSEATNELVGPCRVMRTASRAPLVAGPKAAIQAGVDVCAASVAEGDRLEQAWRAALASVAFPEIDAPGPLESASK